MASFGLQILVSVVLLSFFSGQMDCKVERYALHITEKGTPFIEDVNVDVENQTEVIRVPQHNDVEAMEMMNDFAASLSVRRIPSTRVCHVSALDQSLPSPQKMKLDMEQVSKQPLPDKVSIEKTATRVLGFANRSALPQRILDFCGSFPIFNVEEIPLDTMNASLHMTRGQGRKKRHHEITTYHLCDPKYETVVETCQQRHGFNFTMTCSFETLHCYYIAECKHKSHVHNREYVCDEVIHKLNYRGFCCIPSC